MNEEQQGFVEDFGLFFEQLGVTRMTGRVLGALLISDPPERSAEELANLLRASRGSISHATRMLIQWQLVQRRSKPGERRNYFSVKLGAWRELMRFEIDTLNAMRQMAERGLDLSSCSSPESRRGLEEMRDFYGYLEEELPALFKRWEESRQDREVG